MLKTISLVGTRARVCFVHHGDRYAHAVEFLVDGLWQTAFESAEGSPEEPWPVSPPLQSIHVPSESAEVQQAFLVGQSGRGHWSVCVSVHAASDRITFDVACRCQSPAEFLGSSYRSGAGIQRVTSGTLLTLPYALGECSVVNTENHSTDGSTGFKVVPHLPSKWSFPATIQWKYEFRQP